MMDEFALALIESREAAATGQDWTMGQGPDGGTVIMAAFRDGHSETIRITRERALAGTDDLQFIARARHDIRDLIAAMRGADIADPVLDEINARCSAASPGPWSVYLEADGGVGGSSVIVVSEDDGQPDLYVWIGDRPAPDADFEFIGEARQDIPKLVSELRSRREKK